MNDKRRKKIRYRVKVCIYNSLVVGKDAFDECMPCVWYGNKCKGDGTEKRCRYRPIKFRKVTMKKMEKHRKKYKERKDVGLK